MSADSDPAIDAERFRHVLGHLPTGVTVVAAYSDGKPVGMASNSVTSVSLQPPLVLFCPAKVSTSWPKIRASGRFTINIFASHQEEASRQFSQVGIDRFAGVAWHRREGGPALDDAVAWIDCTIEAEYEAGDHWIVVGAVDRLEVRDAAADPLVFFRGRYGSFVEEQPHGD